VDDSSSKSVASSDAFSAASSVAFTVFDALVSLAALYKPVAEMDAFRALSQFMPASAIIASAAAMAAAYVNWIVELLVRAAIVRAAFADGRLA
jgi:hypothetical protein